MEFVLNEYHRNVSNEELLADVKRVANSLNINPLTQRVYKKQGKYGLNTFRRHFGSWDKALELCGIQTKKVDTDKLLEDVRRLHEFRQITTLKSSKQKACYSEFLSMVIKSWQILFIAKRI